MSTTKRDRQRENRRLRLAANATDAKRYAVRRRIKLIGSLAVLAAALLAVVGWLQSREGSEDSNGDPQPTEDSAIDEEQAEEAGAAATDPDQAPEESAEPADASAPPGCPEPDGSSGRVIDFDGPQPMCIDGGARYTAVFDTSEGEIRFDLTAEATPLTVNNFVTLARWGYYDDTLLFRTDPSIDIIQGGSPHTNSASDPGPGYTIADEPTFVVDPDTDRLAGPYRYEPGQLVMARSAGPDAAGAQFFITTGPETALLDSQGTYVVFGRTDDAGLEVAQSIMSLHVDTGVMGGAPSRDVTVRSVTIEETPADG